MEYAVQCVMLKNVIFSNSILIVINQLTTEAAILYLYKTVEINSAQNFSSMRMIILGPLLTSAFVYISSF